MAEAPMATNENALLTTAQAASYLNVAPGTLEVWRSTGRCSIPFLKLGRSVRYRRRALDTWLASRTVTQTA